jgi:hypothetical protein
MSAAAFRLLAFVALAAGSTALWLGFLHTGTGEVGVAPAIPPVASQSIFAPAAVAPTSLTQMLAPGLSVKGLVTAPACPSCTLRLGAGGLVRARVGSGAAERKAYALLDLGAKGDSSSLVARDVIALGRGEQPLGPVRVAQMLDAAHRVIFELVATPDRRLHLVSPPGGLRSGPLSLPVDATVPNDGVSGVAIEIAMRRNRSLSVYVNGIRTATVSDLHGATTAAPRYLAAGVVQYAAPADAPAITAVHTQVSVSAATPQPQQSTPPAAPTPTPPPTPQPLANTAPPTVSGTGVVGNALSAGPGGWSDSAATFSYQWQRCDASGACTAIAGAASPTYTLTSADRDALVRVRVTATAPTGSAAKASAAVGPVLPLPPASLTPPTVAGDATVGSTLTATLGTWDDQSATVTFVWRRCDPTGACTTIDGADGLTYSPTSDDVGFALRVRVTAANAGGSSVARSTLTAAVVRPVPVPPSSTGAPFVTGDAVLGSELTANPGTWSDPAATFAYAWQRCDATGACTAIDGATASTYTLTGDDVGRTLRVEVTAAGTNGASATADSTAVGPVVVPAPSSTSAPSVSGNVVVGSTLTADPGGWSDSSATLAYQWQRCDASGSSCTAIDGATASTYTLTGDDGGSTVRVEVTATNAGGSTAADSTALGPVATPPPPPPPPPPAPSSTSAPSVSGNVVVGSTLTADPGGWSDSSATLAYQWQRCDASGSSCTAIDGATASTYTLTGDDGGSTVRVEVTATNAGGSTPADSTALGPVPIPPPSPPPGDDDAGTPSQPQTGSSS